MLRIGSSEKRSDFQTNEFDRLRSQQMRAEQYIDFSLKFLDIGLKKISELQGYR